ncbi:MAG: hypothetical protein ACKO7R_00905 [Pseudanabaena sp.]
MSTASDSDKGSIGTLGEVVGVGLGAAVGVEVAIIVGSIDADGLGLATDVAIGLWVTAALLGVELLAVFVVGLDERVAIKEPIAIAVAKAPPHAAIHKTLLLPLPPLRSA